MVPSDNAADDAVALRKHAAQGRHRRRRFAEHGALAAISSASLPCSGGNTLSTPLASTAIVRPPACRRTAVGRPVDPAGQAADDRYPGPGQPCGQPLGLLLPVTGGMARADDGHGHLSAASSRPRRNSTAGGSGISRSSRG